MVLQIEKENGFKKGKLKGFLKEAHPIYFVILSPQHPWGEGVEEGKSIENAKTVVDFIGETITPHAG